MVMFGISGTATCLRGPVDGSMESVPTVALLAAATTGDRPVAKLRAALKDALGAFAINRAGPDTAVLTAAALFGVGPIATAAAAWPATCLSQKAGVDDEKDAKNKSSN